VDELVPKIPDFEMWLQPGRHKRDKARLVILRCRVAFQIDTAIIRIVSEEYRRIILVLGVIRKDDDLERRIVVVGHGNGMGTQHRVKMRRLFLHEGAGLLGLARRQR